MNKLFLFIISSILACLMGTQALAAEVNLNGDFRIRGFVNNNLTDADGSIGDRNAYNSERFILNLAVKSDPAPVRVEGVLTTDFTSSNGTGNARFGQFAFGPAQSSATTCGGGTGTACTQNTFALLQAYLKLTTPYFSFTGGRQVFKIGHGLLVADAVDALVLDIPIGSSTLRFANLKIFDSTRSAGSGGVFVGNGTNGGPGGDTDLYLANLNFSPFTDATFDTYAGWYSDRGPSFITQVNPARTAYGSSAKAEMLILGIAGTAKISRFNTLFEADLMRGVVKDPATRGALLRGYNVLANANTDVGPGNVGLTFVYSSGQRAKDVTSGKRANINGINGDYPLGIITTNVGARSPAPVDGTCPSFSGGGLGGRPGCFAGSGLITFKGSGNITPPSMPKLNIELSVLYNLASKKRPIQTATGSTRFTNGGRKIGTEVDILVRYKVLKDLSLTAGYGILFAGNFFETSNSRQGIGGNPTTKNADNLSVGVLEMRYEF